ncbi:aminotransferase class V-fold PLP-dependent enzyme [Oscillospiraceae bacterium MB08-C2-2]|nr:aminotransferase class V-fold PLP-dependent enzyme [Oscillospiraceae bacterium MB08-C2-2]
MIYFDNGATTFPKPQSVHRAVGEALTRYGANPGRSGHQMSLQTAIKVYDSREAAAQLLGAGAVEDVVFTQNCTQALNIAIKGVLRQGDHVIISDLEHNSVLRPIHTLAERGIITYSVASTAQDDEETVAAFENRIRPNTRLIICTHGSNVFGIRLPIEKLGQLCHKKDILFMVDGAQTAGVAEIDVTKMGIDFFCTAGHKSLYGPSGTGLLITPLGNVLETVMEGGTGTRSMEYSQPESMPDRLESGTVNTMGILGLGAGIGYVKQKGIQNIYNQEMAVGETIFNRLSRMNNILLYTNTFERGKHLPVISFNIEGVSSEETVAKLDQQGFALRGGFHCSPLAHQKMGTDQTGTARISIGSFNTREQAEKLCMAIKKVAG